MAGWNPKMLSVQVPNTVGGTKLSALIAAADPSFTTRLSSILLQMDLAATGNIYMGNKGVTATNCGYNFVAGTAAFQQPAGNNMLLTSDIYLLATINNAQMNIIAQPVSM